MNPQGFYQYKKFKERGVLMLSVVKSYIQAKLNLSERGAEMVEYAIVLACVAAVGVVFYSNSGSADKSLKSVLTDLWSSISGNADKAGQAPTPPAGG